MNKTVRLYFLICILAFSLACEQLFKNESNAQGKETPSVDAIKRSTVTPKPTRTPSSTPDPRYTSTPTPTYEPNDIAFSISCIWVQDKQEKCDKFIANMRDKVYPLMREATGVNLSDCYTSVNYYIELTGKPDQYMNNIYYNQGASISLAPPLEGRQLLHTIAECSGALDESVLHGLILNYVFDRLDLRRQGYFVTQEEAQAQIAASSGKTAYLYGEELRAQCQQLLHGYLALSYFLLDAPSVPVVYQSTINPVTYYEPSKNLQYAWGDNAPKVEALLETLAWRYEIEIYIPDCGYEVQLAGKSAFVP